MDGPGSSAEFAEFVAACSARLLRSAWLLTGDAWQAEDLLQTALAKTWRHWPEVVSAHSPEAYVRRIIFTTFISWWRLRSRGEIPTQTLPEVPDDSSLASAAATRDVVRRALTRLSRQQRAIVVLRFAEDRSVEQTAAILDTSAATVKVQAARALKILRLDPTLGSFTQDGVRG